MRRTPMEPLRAWNFDSPGEIEYVLGKAGFYQAIRTESGSRVEPTDKLRQIFPGGVVPAEEMLIPLLTRIIDLCDRLGAVNRDAEKSQVITALKTLGVTHEHGAISQLFADIRQATQQAARDVAALPPFRGL